MIHVFKGLLVGGGLLIFYGLGLLAVNRGPLPTGPTDRKVAIIYRRVNGWVAPNALRLGVAFILVGIIGRLVTGHF